MKSNKTTILLILIACLAAYTIFQNHKIKTDINEYNAKIDTIKKEVDSVYTVNKEIDSQIENVDNYIASMEKNVNDMTKNITLIKNDTDEKVNIVTTIGNVELEQLFANRYGN
jgi:peptidoglycan hydrolase CwlO-like protein